MELIAAEKVAARVRAALAYANIDVNKSDTLIGIGRSTMARIVSPSKPRGASIEELWRIADACGVPRSFMERGFDTPSEVPADVTKRLERIEEAVGQIGTLDELVEQVWATLASRADGSSTQEAIAATRSVKERALASAGADPSTQAADSTRDGEDATPEAPPSRPLRTRRTGQESAR
jgi:hypothetical protein